MIKRLLPLSIVLAGALIAGSFAWAYATIPDRNGVINGCRKVSDGTLRVIDTDKQARCPSGYRALNWNQTGPAGPAGSSGWEVVRKTTESALTDGGYWVASTSVLCPGGKIAVGGGFAYDNAGQSNPAEVKATSSGFRNYSYLPGALPTAWEAGVEARVKGTLEVSVMCANPAA